MSLIVGVKNLSYGVFTRFYENLKNMEYAPEDTLL